MNILEWIILKINRIKYCKTCFYYNHKGGCWARKNIAWYGKMGCSYKNNRAGQI